MERKVPLWVLVLVIFLGLNFTVIFSGLGRHVGMNGVRHKLGGFGPFVEAISGFPSLVKQTFIALKKENRLPLMIESRFPGLEGFEKNGVPWQGALEDDGYLLLSAYDKRAGQSTVKLIRISDQRVLHEWVPNISKLLEVRRKAELRVLHPEKMEPARYRILHPLVLADGGIVLRFGEMLFKIDSCSNIEWSVDGLAFHHSVEQDADGNFWIPSIIEPSSYDEDIFIDYRDDAIALVSPRGEVLFKKSVSRILEENGYRGLLFGVGPYDKDAIHLNDIQPATYSTKYWQKGDLLLSIRDRSSVCLYRPSEDRIIWLRTGPWLNQHDVDFVGESKISVFGNDTISYPGNIVRGETRDVDHVSVKHNDVYVFDFADGSVSTPYAGVLSRLDVRTPTEGRQEILENGDVFIEETDYGRTLRLSAERVVWQFAVTGEDDSIAMVSWSRYLTREGGRDILAALEKAKCL